jgi:hypothetical protein
MFALAGNSYQLFLRMCGRYRRTTKGEELARICRIPIPKQPDLPVIYNIAPSQNVLAIIKNGFSLSDSVTTFNLPRLYRNPIFLIRCGSEGESKTAWPDVDFS